MSKHNYSRLVLRKLSAFGVISPSFFDYKRYCVVKIGGNRFTIARVISMPALATPSDRQGFDYSTLDSTTSQFVQQQTGEIRALMKRTAQDIIEVGQKLLQVKKKLGHGRFGDWLQAEFQWSISAATRFMQVSEQFQFVNLANLDLAPSALYELAAPSTPPSARDEAVARAKAGEPISYTTAKTIKQKYAPPSKKPKPEAQQPEPVPQQKLPSPSISTPTPLPQSSSKLEIVAFRPQSQAPVLPQVGGVIASPGQTLSVPQTNQTVSVPNVPGDWWQLGGKHLLYCGDPHSPEFLERIPQNLNLLLAFPPILGWLPAILAKTYIISTEYLPQGKNLDQLDENLESNVLFHSQLGEIVVSCFLPSPEILSVISRLDRRGLFAEPDSKRYNAVISDWKKAGLKVERLS